MTQIIHSSDKRAKYAKLNNSNIIVPTMPVARISFRRMQHEGTSDSVLLTGKQEHL